MGGGGGDGLSLAEASPVLPRAWLTVILLNEGRLATEVRSAGLSVQVVDESHNSFPQIANAIRKIFAPHPPGYPSFSPVRGLPR